MTASSHRAAAATTHSSVSRRPTTLLKLGQDEPLMATSSKTPTIKEIEKRLDVLTQTVQRCEGMRQVNGVWVSTCVTCGRVLPCFGPNCMQGGHAIPRGCRITRWLPEVVHCQCVTGDTILLTHNYREVRQDEVKVGDAIMGFDEINQLSPKTDDTYYPT